MTIEGENRDEQDEPIGIVISRGRNTERPPRFSAYVWGAAEDDEREGEVVEVGAA